MSSNRSAKLIRAQSNRNFAAAVKDVHKHNLLQKRRDSDAKCRANLSYSFEQLREQVLDEKTINTRVSREMILQETLWKIQYLEGILLLLDQTKDKQEGKYYMKSAVARLDAIHREFTKSYSSSSHGNRKPKEKFLSANLRKKSKMISARRSDVMILPKLPAAPGSKATNVADQVVPKPSPQIHVQTRIVKGSPPDTIIVPYIGRKNKEYGPQEVPVCYSPRVRQSTPQKLSKLTLASSYVSQKGIKDSPNGTPSRRYKIKGSSIKCVPMDDMSWNNVDLDTSDTDSAESSPEPDLTCKEVFPYWLEEDRSERRIRMTSTVTPPKPPNTSQMTYPYPMAPRKSKNTTWSAKYMEHCYQNTATYNNVGFRRQQQRPGKRLFTEAEIDAGNYSDKTWSSPNQNAYYIDGNYDVKPKRHYRKLCTAARVRPYNPVTGKVESPCQRYKTCRNTKHRVGRDDPEFSLNSYYKRKMKKDDKSVDVTITSRRQTKRTPSPKRMYHGIDVMDDWMRKEEERQNTSSANDTVKLDKEEENSSQYSLVLTDVPHLPEDMISPLDIDDDGIVDTILDLEESSMPHSDSPPLGSSIQVQSTKPSPAGLSDNEAFGDTYFGECEVWNAPDLTDEEFKRVFNSQSSENSTITPSLAAYACLAFSNPATGKSAINKTSPVKQEPRTATMMSPVVYFSPIKQTPLIGSNPTLSSTYMSQTDDDQLVNITKESYSDLSFTSPLSTSSLISSLDHHRVIDLDNIKDVKEVHFTKDDLSEETLSKEDGDFWDIDKMMDINSSLDQLIDREVFLCSPKIVPRNFIACSPDVEVPSKMCTSDAADQLLPSSWKSKDSASPWNSQDSLLEYQVVPNFLHSEDDEILDLRVPAKELN